MFLPVMFNIKGKKIGIIGGGKVAFRKITALLEFDADIEVISPDFTEEFNSIKDKVKLTKESYKESSIKEMDIVIAATSSKGVNEEIINYCRESNILGSNAGDGRDSDIVIPSILKRGDLTIAVSTNGKSPALAAKIKRDMEAKYTEEYDEYIEILGQIRSLVLEKCSDETIKRKILKSIINMDIEELKERRVLYEGCHRITGE